MLAAIQGVTSIRAAEFGYIANAKKTIPEFAPLKQSGPKVIVTVLVKTKMIMK